MARCVAMLRFADGAELFAVYCNTTDLIVGRELFDTAELAQAARDAHEEAIKGRGISVLQGQAPAGVEASAEPAVVYPNWQHDDLRFEFRTRANRRHRWLTGSKGLDDVVREQDDGWFTEPPPTSAE